MTRASGRPGRQIGVRFLGPAYYVVSAPALSVSTARWTGWPAYLYRARTAGSYYVAGRAVLQRSPNATGAAAAWASHDGLPGIGHRPSSCRISSRSGSSYSSDGNRLSKYADLNPSKRGSVIRHTSSLAAMDISIQALAHVIRDSSRALTASAGGTDSAPLARRTRNSESHICALAYWNLAYSCRLSFRSSCRRSVLY